MSVKFTNNAYTTLTSTISAGATSFDIASAASFPVLGVGDWTYLSLTNEVVKVTAITGLTCTCDPVVGGHATGIAVELRMTAELLNDFAEDTESVPVTGGTFTGSVTAPDFIGNLNGAVRFAAKNAEGSTLTKGQVVYISGISGEVPTVALADASDSNKMPAYGLVYADANNNASVEIVTFGTLSDTAVPTATYTTGDTLYVSTTPGAFTKTAPTGETAQLQNIGTVQRAHDDAGSIKVGGAGRTNATPNLDDGNVFIGNTSNQAESRALVIADTTGLQTALDSKLTPTGDGSQLTGIDALPAQATHSGQFLTTNGTAASWDDVPPGGTQYFEQATSPASPINGMFWLDTDDEILYQYQSGAWVQVSTASMPAILGIDSSANATAMTIDVNENVTFTHKNTASNPVVMDASTRIPIGSTWTVAESAGVLYFAVSGVNKMKLDASGNLTVTGNVTGYGTV